MKVSERHPSSTQWIQPRLAMQMVGVVKTLWSHLQTHSPSLSTKPGGVFRILVEAAPKGPTWDSGLEVDFSTRVSEGKCLEASYLWLCLADLLVPRGFLDIFKVVFPVREPCYLQIKPSLFLSSPGYRPFLLRPSWCWVDLPVTLSR